MTARSKLDRDTMMKRLEGFDNPTEMGGTDATTELIEFIVWMKRVGADTREIPLSTIISNSDEEKYRSFYYTTDWRDWADRNRMYRTVRIEVKPYKD